MTRPSSSPIHREAALYPGQRIVDAHHHLYHRPGIRYLLDEYLADLRSGHDVRATVFVQARSMFLTDGPEEMMPVGETEFANRVADQCVADHPCTPRVAAAIVGQADLTLGEAVRPVLESHVAAGGDRFRGIRHVTAWDIDGSLLNPVYPTGEHMLEAPEFRAGFAQLELLGMTFDAWLFFSQIPHLTVLARAYPNIPIVLNHCGGIVRTGRYAGRHDEVYAQWSLAISELATCPNVMVKLGGLGLPLSGFGFDARKPPSSFELAAAWLQWFEHCIDAFGPERCMFESNFPADKGSYEYGTGWNAMKRITSGASQTERDDLFWRSASRFYRLPPL